MTTAAVEGTGFAFFCEHFTPSERDGLTCNLCGCLESEHPVHVDAAGVASTSTPPAPAHDDEDYETWRLGAIARCDRMLEEVRATTKKLDRIAEQLADFKRRNGIQ